MENLNQYTEKDTEILYNWGTASVRIDASTMIIENGTITDEDVSLWSIIPSSVASPIREIIFENVAYEGSMDNMFDSSIIRRVTSIDLSGLNTTKVTSAETVFTRKNTYLSEVTFGDKIYEESEITSTSRMFYQCGMLKTINLNGLDLTNNTNMEEMFYECQSLEELSWTNLNTSKVETMESLFNSCLRLKSIDLTNFNTQNVTSMYRMFYSNTALKEVSADNWDTAKVTTMEEMFYLCYEIEFIYINNWSHQPVLKSTKNMFYTNRRLKELHMQNFDTKNVETMEQMFLNCGILTELDVSSFDTANVTNYNNMFRSMNQLRDLNISNFDTDKAETMSDMFAYDHQLQRITLGSKTFLDESTNLPPIAPIGVANNTDKTNRPTSWVSIKNFETYESTRSFLNDYTPIEEGEDTFTRGYPYGIEYYDQITNNLLYQNLEITHEDFFLLEYKDSRRYIDSWQLNGEDLNSENSYKNLGITVSTTPELGKVTRLFNSGVKDIAAETNVKWAFEKEVAIIDQDKSVPSWNADIVLDPRLTLDGTLANEEDIYYKLEIIDSDKNIKLSEDRIVKAKANEPNEINLCLHTENLMDVENIRVNFYQLSFSEINDDDRVSITDLPNAQLDIIVSIFDSFKINNYPSLFKWEFSQSNSIGVLERSPENETSLEVLNSRFEENDWQVKLHMNATENSPFHFMWRSTNGADLPLDSGEPIVIMNNHSAETDDGYKYSKQWNSTQGLLIKSEELINPGNYGQNIKAVWTLEQSPDFS